MVEKCFLGKNCFLGNFGSKSFLGNFGSKKFLVKFGLFLVYSSAFFNHRSSHFLLLGGVSSSFEDLKGTFFIICYLINRSLVASVYR